MLKICVAQPKVGRVKIAGEARPREGARASEDVLERDIGRRVQSSARAAKPIKVWASCPGRLAPQRGADIGRQVGRGPHRGLGAIGSADLP